MSASQKYPRISDMVMPAARRLPAFVHAYLAAGTGQGQAMARNEAAYADIHLMPRFLRGRVTRYTLLCFWKNLFRSIWCISYWVTVPYLAGR